MTDLIAYTDGSGTFGRTPSGAGVALFDGGVLVAEASRHLGLGTNNHAEISAIRIALWMTTFEPFTGRPLLIRSDSEYAIHMCSRTGWIDDERPNGRLIRFVRAAMVGRAVAFEHVKGHAGELGNERADFLAGMGRKRSWKEPVAKRRGEPATVLPERAFGHLLRRTREGAGLTMGALADALGMKVVRLSNIERGLEAPPSALMIRLAAKALRCDEASLLGAAETTQSTRSEVA